MESGLLYLETSASHPGLVRIRAETDQTDSLSETQKAPGDDADGRLVLRFHDIDAARMHAHQAMRGRLVDVDVGTYRVPLVEAIACIQAIKLKHQPVYLDPTLTGQMLGDITKRVQAKKRHAANVDRIWQIVGGLAVAFLVLLGTTLGRN